MAEALVQVPLQREDLPETVRPTDVLTDVEQAVDASDLARSLHLRGRHDKAATWASLGALAAILRLVDDGRRLAVIVDESGSGAPLGQWARAIGFAPVRMNFTGSAPAVAALDVDAGSLDVVVRIHPNGSDGADIDHVLAQSEWALRPGGLLITTLPVGPPGADGAVGAADVRAVLARADDAGFALVGDLDGELTTRMREAAVRARVGDAAYGLVLLTFRRR